MGLVGLFITLVSCSLFLTLFWRFVACISVLIKLFSKGTDCIELLDSVATTFSCFFLLGNHFWRTGWNVYGFSCIGCLEITLPKTPCFSKMPRTPLYSHIVTQFAQPLSKRRCWLTFGSCCPVSGNSVLLLLEGNFLQSDIHVVVYYTGA